MLIRSEHCALLFPYRNHAARGNSRSFCLILRRTNKNFRKCVDSFSTLPIMRLHTAGVISSAGRAPPLQGGGRRFDPVITHHLAFALLIPPATLTGHLHRLTERSPTQQHQCRCRSFGAWFSPVTSSAQADSTSELLQFERLTNNFRCSVFQFSA